MPWMSRRLPGVTRWGRRTLILLHGGATWVIFGWAVYTIPIERFSRPGPGGALEIMDTPYPGIMWVAFGALAFVAAFTRRRFRGGDAWGFVGLTTPPIVWLICYLWSAIAFFVTDGGAGNQRAGVGVLTWYFVSAFVLIVAGWPDPDDPTIRTRSRGPGDEA